jgi:hypothetical protein
MPHTLSACMLATASQLFQYLRMPTLPGYGYWCLDISAQDMHMAAHDPDLYVNKWTVFPKHFHATDSQNAPGLPDFLPIGHCPYCCRFLGWCRKSLVGPTCGCFRDFAFATTDHNSRPLQNFTSRRATTSTCALKPKASTFDCVSDCGGGRCINGFCLCPVGSWGIDCGLFISQGLAVTLK